MTRSIPALVALATLLSSSLSLAETPADAAKVDKAKPQEAAAAPPAAPTPDFTQEAQATGGGMFNDGNVSALSARAGAYWQMRYLAHGLRVEGGAGVATLAQDPDGDPANGFDVPLGDAKNKWNSSASARLRYDFFLTDSDSLYAAGFVFHDSAANLLVRLRTDLGYRRVLFSVPKHSMSAEVGAVYTIDNTPTGVDSNNDGAIDIADETAFEESMGTIGARLAVSYTNALTDALAYTTNLELVPNIFPDVDAPFETARLGDGDDKLGFGEATILTWNNTLTLQLSQALSVGATLGVILDNGAIVRRNAYANHDIAATLQLGYKLF